MKLAALEQGWGDTLNSFDRQIPERECLNRLSKIETSDESPSPESGIRQPDRSELAGPTHDKSQKTKRSRTAV